MLPLYLKILYKTIAQNRLKVIADLHKLQIDKILPLNGFLNHPAVDLMTCFGPRKR